MDYWKKNKPSISDQFSATLMKEELWAGNSSRVPLRRELAKITLTFGVASNSAAYTQDRHDNAFLDAELLLDTRVIDKSRT